MNQKIQWRCLIFILVLVFSSTVKAGVPVVEWITQLGSSDTDIGYSVSVDSNGDVYVTGRTCGNFDGNSIFGDDDIFLTKYGSNGTKLWSKQFGTNSDDHAWSLSIDDNGNIYIAGYTEGSFNSDVNKGSYDIFLAKCDKNGNKLWTEQLGTTSTDYCPGMSVDGSGNVYVTGYTGGSLNGNVNAGDYDVFLTKYDTDGNRLWVDQLGTANADCSYGVSVDRSGNVFITGYTCGDLDGNANQGGYDVFLIKYNMNSIKQWTRQLGTAKKDIGLDVSVDNNGNVYVTGRTEGSLEGNVSRGRTDMFLAKYDINGTKLWIEQQGSIGDDYGLGVAIDGSGNAYVAGHTSGGLDGYTNAGFQDILITKYDASGAQLWTEQLGAEFTDYGCDVSVDDNGNIYVTGATNGGLGDAIQSKLDMFLMKVSTVPEPGSFVMLTGIALMVLLYRRRRYA